jgi:glycosyltransferase involved in cell wall biosynthesis
VLKHFAFAVPGDLSAPTGGYAYDRRIVAELRKLGWRVDVIELGDDFPRPSIQAKAMALTRLETVPPGLPIVIDGLAFGVLPEVAAALRVRNPLIELVHLPLALEPGLDRATAQVLRESERDALARADHAVVTSPMTARILMRDYHVTPDRLTVARPGTDRATPRPHSAGLDVALLAVGSVVPGKGYDSLIDALGRLRELAWHLLIVGNRKGNLDTTTALDAQIARLGLSGRVRFAGALAPDQVAAQYQAADVFVLPSRFETYGMVYAEAMANGLPIVATTAGAIPDTVPASAGVLVPTDDAAALAAALGSLITDPAERARLAAGARAAGAVLPSWADSARIFSEMLKQIVAGRYHRSSVSAKVYDETAGIKANRARRRGPKRGQA